MDKACFEQGWSHGWCPGLEPLRGWCQGQLPGVGVSGVSAGDEGLTRGHTGSVLISWPGGWV